MKLSPAFWECFYGLLLGLVGAGLGVLALYGVWWTA